MIISLKGRKALVGGSSSGLGFAAAESLAGSGATVTIAGRNADKLALMADRLPRPHAQEHSFLQVDYSDFDDYQRRIGAYFKQQQVDILVNNTQGPEGGGALEKQVGDYQQAFDLLFKTVVSTTELALESMIGNQWGRVINIASVSVKEPLSYLALSNAIRAAVTTWAKSLSIDVGQYGITVNSILTGFFDTDRLRQLNAKKAEKLGVAEYEVRKKMEESTAVKRIGRPEEYGQLVSYLASENAGFITGTAIPIDGGYLRSL